MAGSSKRWISASPLEHWNGFYLIVFATREAPPLDTYHWTGNNRPPDWLSDSHPTLLQVFSSSASRGYWIQRPSLLCPVHCSVLIFRAGRPQEINSVCHQKNDISLLNMPNGAGPDNNLSPIVPLRGPVDVIGIRFLRFASEHRHWLMCGWNCSPGCDLCRFSTEI